MASFQIYQDSEKENPQNMHKEKIVGIAKAAAAMAANGKSAGGGGGGGPLSRINNDRSNAATAALKNNEKATLCAGTKVAFRDINNYQAKDEKLALKKSNVIPVVQQFKAFSVYEDPQENAAAVDEQRHQIAASKPIVTSDTISNEFDLHHDDYDLDTTPMSVSDVLSPMSVDRSMQYSQSATKENEPPKIDMPLPRNDRQRFFEVVQYQSAILAYFRESERKHRPKPHYMKRQTDINQSMRTILVDWLVEVSEEYNLDTETLHLSVSYIDRFLSQMSVVRSKLQLVGTAAMYIASKYEEIYPPDVGEFVFITDDTYTKAQVLRMEQIILKILAFDLCTPTTYVYINTYATMTDMPENLKFLSMYICELSLLDADPFLRFYPSQISASAVALARYILDLPIWSEHLEETTSYRISDLKEIVLCLSKAHNDAAELAQQAIQEKYKADKYKQVSKIKAMLLTEDMFAALESKYMESTLAGQQQTAALQKNSSENVRRMISLMFNDGPSNNK